MVCSDFIMASKDIRKISLNPSSWLAISVKSAEICVLLNCIGSSFLVVFSDH